MRMYRGHQCTNGIDNFWKDGLKIPIVAREDDRKVMKTVKGLRHYSVIGCGNSSVQRVLTRIMCLVTQLSMPNWNWILGAQWLSDVYKNKRVKVRRRQWRIPWKRVKLTLTSAKWHHDQPWSSVWDVFEIVINLIFFEIYLCTFMILFRNVVLNGLYKTLFITSWGIHIVYD